MRHKQNEIVVSSPMISLQFHLHLHLANDRCTSSIRIRIESEI